MENLTPLEKTLELIEKNDFKVYFFVVGFGGKPMASVEYIYEAALAMSNNGYDVTMLYQEDNSGEFIKVNSWLGNKFDNLKYVSITKNPPNVTSADIFFIPEMFPSLMENLKDIPCHKIIISQNMFKILENIGDNFASTWDRTYRITDVITTSKNQSDYIKNIYPNCNTAIVEPFISDYFESKTDLKTPSIAIHTRKPSDTKEIIYNFYNKYPMYKFFSFVNMHNLPKEKFASELDKCCGAIWIDRESSYGTFPLECMKSNVPLIGVMPDMLSDYMVDSEMLNNNAIWVRSKYDLHTVLAEYVTTWLNDTVPEELSDNEKYYKDLTQENFSENFLNKVKQFVSHRKEMINKLIQQTKIQTLEPA